jgi:23S rRNA pseudouridine1911/1915/1917 synthase
VTCDAQTGQPLLAAADLAGERLDVFCARTAGQTRAQMQRVIESAAVQVNGQPAKANHKLKLGDSVCIALPAPAPVDIAPEDIPLSIIYEDADMAVIDKPQGMVVHPAAGNAGGTLVNAALYHLKDLSGIGGEMRPGIVHRIDKLTSGLIVMAKNDVAHQSLSAQLKAHTARRTYLALVEGNIKQEEGTVNAPIGRHRLDRKKMAVTSGGRAAITHWRVLMRYGDFTLVEARLETGRTHQIRVHLASLGHPVAGDTVYGPAKPKLGLKGQALHAARLTLRHPRTGEEMTFAAPVPGHFLSALKRAGYTGDIEAFLRQSFGE